MSLFADLLVDWISPDEDASTALHVAATAGFTAAVVLLLKHGWNADAVDLKNRTALELAVAHGHIDCVKVPLSSGFQILLLAQSQSQSAPLGALEKDE